LVRVIVSEATSLRSGREVAPSSALRGHGTRNISGADAFERQAIAGAFVD
jgi:hypothetical protein